MVADPRFEPGSGPGSLHDRTQHGTEIPAVVFRLGRGRPDQLVSGRSGWTGCRAHLGAHQRRARGDAGRRRPVCAADAAIARRQNQPGAAPARVDGESLRPDPDCPAGAVLAQRVAVLRFRGAAFGAEHVDALVDCHCAEHRARTVGRYVATLADSGDSLSCLRLPDGQRSATHQSLVDAFVLPLADCAHLRRRRQQSRCQEKRWPGALPGFAVGAEESRQCKQGKKAHGTTGRRRYRFAQLRSA